MKLDIGSPQQIEHEEKVNSEKVAAAKKVIHSTKNTSNGQNFELIENNMNFSHQGSVQGNNTFDSPYEVASIVPQAKKALGQTRKSQQHPKAGGSGISLVQQNFSKTNMKLNTAKYSATAQPKDNVRQSTTTASYLEKLATEAGVSVEKDKPMTSKSQTRNNSVGKKASRPQSGVPSHLRQSTGKVRTQKASSGNITA